MKRILISVFILLNSISAYANTFSVATSPASVSHSVSLNPAINLLWGVTGSPGVHTSTVGVFRASTGNKGASLGSIINTTINISCPAGAPCLIQAEVVTIPADVLTFAETNGLTTIFYNRTFSDGFAATGSLQINLNFSVTPPGTLPVSGIPSTSTINPERTLHITRETLRFNDNSTVIFTKQNTPITAVAELKFTGTGLLDAFWEYATPASTTGRAIFIRMNSVRRYLGAGGRVILQSPPLPTDLTGQYLIRLQILKTASNPNGVEFTNDIPNGLPVLRYTIGRQDGNAYALPPIKTQYPLNNAYLQADTRFNWQPIKNAKAYQLELYLPDSRKRPTINPSTNVGVKPIDDSVIENKRPSTGLLIPATETSLVLSSLSRETLKRGQSYYWRVIAIGANGQVLTTSNLKAIRTP